MLIAGDDSLGVAAVAIRANRVLFHHNHPLFYKSSDIMIHTCDLLSYIDPMSGAILLQVLAAAAIGCVAFFRRSILGIVGLAFRGKITRRK